MANWIKRGLLASLGLIGGALWIDPSSAAGAQPAMIIPGNFAVTSTGAATYNVPITVPPGTAGMAPSLSLQYSSSAGDGVQGLGWTLSGLLTVVRCPRTIAQDTTHGSVNFDMDDRFCLNGQRLMLINGPGHSYGDDGSEYRTEIESFTRIIAHGNAGYGPAWFEVRTKSGQIMQLGNTADSQVLATGKTTARAWAVNRVSDTAGNYMTVIYNSASGSDRTTNGELYPLEIDYAGNTRAGTSPYNSVKFTYNCVDGVGTCRSDSIPRYQTGSKEQLTALLTNVKTYQGANLVFNYQLAYRAGTSIVHSRLTSITQCDGASNCLPALTFGWQGGTQAQAVSSNIISALAVGSKYLPADYNGDGLTDYALIPSGISVCPPFSIYLGTSSPGFSSSSLTLPNPAASFPLCGANLPAQTILTPTGDAAVTILVQGNTGPPLYTTTTFVSLLTSTNALNVAQFQMGTTYTYSGPSPGAGDFNGDGIPDIFMQTYPDTTIFTGSSSGSFSPNTYTGMPWTTTLTTIADFDGDGCSDIYAQAIGAGGTNAVNYAPYCHPAISTTSLPMPSGSVPFLGDYNGDGKTDVIGLDSGGVLRLWLSTGTGFTQVATVPSNPLFVGDFNGDGRSDYVDSTGALYLSTGAGFTAALDGNNSPITFPTSAFMADWNNDGAADLLVPGPSSALMTGLAYVPELMTSISNGIGATTAISYDRLNKNGTFYQKCSTAGTYNCSDTYPLQSLNGPINVVSEVDTSNGLGSCPTNCYITTYAYAMAKADLQGRGFLGFGKVITTDPQTNIVETTNYSQTFPYIGLVTSKASVHLGTTLSTITNTLANNSGCGSTVTPAASGVYIVCTTQTVQANNDLNGTTFPTVTTVNTYDSYGNALTNNASVSDGSYKNTTNTYSNDTTNWILGRLLTVSVTSHVGSSTMVRASSFAYDSLTGLLTQEVLEPGVSTCNSGTSSCTLTTDYVLDLFGHRTVSTMSGTGITTRSSSAVYDALGQFQIKTINALGQSESWTFDSRFGAPTSQTGPNLLTTSWTYDTLGRMTQETRADGTLSKTSYGYCSSGCPTYGAFSVQSEAFAADGVTQIGAISTGYNDSLSRPIAKDTQGFSGAIIRVATQYDAKARVLQTSRPYYTASDSPRFTVFAYDDLGRATQATMPDSSIATYCFNGLATAVTNNLNQTTTTTRNAQGVNASVVRGTGVTGSTCSPTTSVTTTSYIYNAFGNLLTVTDSATPTANVITNGYDIRGNKVSSIDPDMGTWTYTYDVLSELISQTDAKSQVTSLTYDLLGRLLTKSEASQYNSWIYGVSPGAHNIGKVIDARACTSSACTTITSDRSFTFDGVGRPDSVTLATGGQSYGYHQSYATSNGALSRVGYPSGFAANYIYNSYGYLTSMTDDPGAQIWASNTRDAEMHLTSQTQGNGDVIAQTFDPNTGLIQTQKSGVSAGVVNFAYTFDTIGNLTARTDNIQAYTERFCYDSLNRLVNFNIAAACTGGKTAAYDSTGNITSRSEVGTYFYPSSGSARPHAVSSITGSVDGLTNPKYTYDANGNWICTSTTANCAGTIGRQLTVTSFNMAATLTQGTTSLTLTYDDQHARIAQATTVSGTTTTTTYLNDPVSGVMSQKVQVGSAVPQWVDYIRADGQIVAQRTITYQSGSLWGFNNWAAFNWGAPTTGSKWGSFNWGAGTWTGPLITWAYFSLDHLGSVAAISDQGGNVTQRIFYDPWGKRRNANGTDATCGTITSTVTRGFTNQEQMPVGCLVNLNARVYDAKIGRFMAADSIIPDPADGQSFNRFSYVNNNPLAATDPTGHDGCVGLTNCVVVPGIHYSGQPINRPNGSLGAGGNEFYLTDYSSLVGFSASISLGDAGSRQDRYLYWQPGPLVVTSLAPAAFGSPTPGSPTSTGMGAAGLSQQGILADSNGTNTVAANFVQDETVVVTATRIEISWSLRDFAATAGVTVGGAGVLTDTIHYTAGKTTFGLNANNILKSRFYTNGWRGNQYVSAGKIASGAELAGHGLVGLSVGLDTFGWYNGDISGGQFAANLTVDAVSVLAGAPGAILGAAYWGVETFYRGGFDGLAKDYSNSTIGRAQSLTEQYAPGTTTGSRISFSPWRRKNLSGNRVPRARDRGIDYPRSISFDKRERPSGVP